MHTEQPQIPTRVSTRPAILPTLNRAVNAFGVHSLFHTMDALGQMSLPTQKGAEIHEVEVTWDVAYGEDRAHRMDVWRPAGPAPEGGWPCAMFVHGGGFTALSKRTHWAFARVLARRGWVVFSIDYRLAPEHSFPTPVQDAARALEWIGRKGAEHGADTDRLALYGESAGANLVTALAVACSYRRDELWARHLYDSGVRPKALLSMSGLLQVSDPERYTDRASVSRAAAWALDDACRAYLPYPASAESAMADPLVVLEQRATPDRPLPQVFAAVGTKDPLVEDTRRLERALWALGASVTARYYRGVGHSFMAFLWRKQAQLFWKDALGFLEAAVSKEQEQTPEPSQDRMGA